MLEVLSRLNPKHEMFEETIVPKEVCLDMGLCKEKQSSLGLTLRRLLRTTHFQSVQNNRYCRLTVSNV